MAQPSKSEPTYEPDLTGLLIVDPYNDFLSDGGKLFELSRSTLESNNVVEHMRQVLAAARATGVRVFIAPHHRWRKSDPYEHWKTMPPIQDSAAAGHIFADGTWGGNFHPDFEPRPGEVVAQEHWLSSGFANTDLDLQLKKHGLRSVIVIGTRQYLHRVDRSLRSRARLRGHAGKGRYRQLRAPRNGSLAAVQYAGLRERRRIYRRDRREA
jgi:ureidoacrylate peracid hydrolase